jgi:hypothetical protein
MRHMSVWNDKKGSKQVLRERVMCVLSFSLHHIGLLLMIFIAILHYFLLFRWVTGFSSKICLQIGILFCRQKYYFSYFDVKRTWGDDKGGPQDDSRGFKETLDEPGKGEPLSHRASSCPSFWCMSPSWKKPYVIFSMIFLDRQRRLKIFSFCRRG